MAATLGYGRADLIAAARDQGARLAYVHNELLTNPAQERLAHDLVEVAPEGFTRAHFVTGGAEANEAALRLARHYHVDRGEPERWRVISPAQSYHGPTIATLALTGRPGLQGPLTPYFTQAFLHIPPTTERFDPTGESHARGARPRPGGSRPGDRLGVLSASRSAAPRSPPTSLRTASGRAWRSGVSATGS